MLDDSMDMRNQGTPKLPYSGPDEANIDHKEHFDAGVQFNHDRLLRTYGADETKSAVPASQTPYEDQINTIFVYMQDEEGMRNAARALAEGEVVGFPTETVYGLGCDARNPEAVAKVYKAKGRPSDNPLIVHVASTDMIPSLVKEITPIAQALIDAFMPGPITVIMKKDPSIPDCVTAKLDTVGIRFPMHPVAQKLIAMSGVPVAAPSANRSGSPSPTKFEHVLKDLDGRVPYIIDGGECQVGLESTVVEATGNWPKILRPGAITMEDLEDALAAAGIQKPTAIKTLEAKQGEPPRAPGMKYRHYAPSCEVRILDAETTKAVIPGAELQEDAHERYSSALFAAYKEAVMRAVLDEQTPIGLFCGEEISHKIRAMFSNKLDQIRIYEFGPMDDVQSASHYLFDGLRTLDEEGCRLICAPSFHKEGIGIAYMNRLEKAAAAKIQPNGEAKTRRQVLMVCSGNTCRSPLAEAILRHLWKESAPHYLVDYPDKEVSLEVTSAGIDAEEGQDYTYYTVQLARYEFNEDLRQGRSTQLTKAMLKDKDLVLCMTKDHSRRLRFDFPDDCERIFSFQEMLDDLFIPDISGNVSDPYGQDYLTYQETAEQIKTILQALFPEILKQWRTS